MIENLTDDEYVAEVAKTVRLLMLHSYTYEVKLSHKILNDACETMLRMLHGRVKILKGEDIKDAN